MAERWNFKIRASQDATVEAPAAPGTPLLTDGKRLLVWAGDGRVVEVREGDVLAPAHDDLAAHAFASAAAAAARAPTASPIAPARDGPM